MSQRSLAAQLNIGSSTIAHYEIGNREPDYETLRLFADFFGVSTDYLLGRTDDPAPPGQAEKTPEERLREAGIEVWLRGEGLTEEDAEVIKAVMESLRKRREDKREKPSS